MSKEDNSGGEAGLQDNTRPDVSSDVPIKDPNADVYDNRGPKKIIRVVTVMAYLFSVSFVGILLSTYYIFLWEPLNPRLIGHLRTDPQMQFLIAAAPSLEMQDLKGKDSIDFSLGSQLNRTSNSFLGRMTQDMLDEDGDLNVSLTQREPDRVSFDKRGRLNTMLHKLRQSLVELLRARQNSSQKVANDNSFIKGRLFNSTKGMNYAKRSLSQRDKSRGNVAQEKTLSDHTNPPSELTGSTNISNSGNTFQARRSATISGTKTNQDDFDGESITDSEQYSIPAAIDRVTIHPNCEKKIDVQRPFEFHTLCEKSAKQDEANKRQLNASVINNEENPSHDSTAHPTITLRLREDMKNRNGTALSFANAIVNNSKLNYISNQNLSNNWITYVLHDRASIESANSSKNPEFHQSLNHSIIKPSLSIMRKTEGKRILANSHVVASFS